MFIANDSNYTFGQFLAVENGADIKAPVYTKCFTDTEALKGYRFVHDPEETNPEKCVSFSFYDETSSAALAMPFGKFAAVSDLTSVMFRLDTEFVESVLRDVPFYHVIVPVENIADGTLKYLVIKMTKEVEIFPDDYPYYELADSFADAQPTSAEAPGGEGGGGESDFSVAHVTITNNSNGDFRLLLPNVNTFNNSADGYIDSADIDGEIELDVILYKGKASITPNVSETSEPISFTATGAIQITGFGTGEITGDGTITIEPSAT